MDNLLDNVLDNAVDNKFENVLDHLLDDVLLDNVIENVLVATKAPQGYRGGGGVGWAGGVGGSTSFFFAGRCGSMFCRRWPRLSGDKQKTLHFKDTCSCSFSKIEPRILMCGHVCTV